MSGRHTHLDPQHPTAGMLRWAYANGIFPMADPRTDRIEWFSPDPRGIIPLDAFHVPKSLAREVRQGRFEVTSDTAFEDVMRACATARSSDNQSWINERLIVAYRELHAQGFAHSIEARLPITSARGASDGELVGGLYGVHLGGAFFGESMFVRPSSGGTNASKVCLVHLVHWLRKRGFILLDTQFWNEHLEQFGCIEISRDAYLKRLQKALALRVQWGEFEPLDRANIDAPTQSRS